MRIKPTDQSQSFSVLSEIHYESPEPSERKPVDDKREEEVIIKELFPEEK